MVSFTAAQQRQSFVTTVEKRATIWKHEYLSQQLLHPYGFSVMDKVQESKLADFIYDGKPGRDGAEHFHNICSKDDERIRIGISQIAQSCHAFILSWNANKKWFKTLFATEFYNNLQETVDRLYPHFKCLDDSQFRKQTNLKAAIFMEAEDLTHVSTDENRKQAFEAFHACLTGPHEGSDKFYRSVKFIAFGGNFWTAYALLTSAEALISENLTTIQEWQNAMSANSAGAPELNYTF